LESGIAIFYACGGGNANCENSTRAKNSARTYFFVRILINCLIVIPMDTRTSAMIIIGDIKNRIEKRTIPPGRPFVVAK
jgi:hypothetical protein